MNKQHSLRAILCIAITTVACDPSSAAEPEDTACMGSKCDDVDDEQACPEDAEVIEMAQDELTTRDGLQREDFDDETAFVEIFEDVNGDGRTEALVDVGISFVGANRQWVLLLSDADRAGCPGVFAGEFSGTSVSIAESRTRDMFDLKVAFVNACSAVISTFSFDGTLYVEGDNEVIDLCEDDSSDDAGG